MPALASLTLTYKGQTHALDLANATTLADLAVLIERATGACAARCAIKLLVPGRKAVCMTTEAPSQLLKDAGILPGVKVMMLATCRQQVAQVQAAKEEARLPGFDHELKLAAARRGTGRTAGPSEPPKGEWTFAEYRSWEMPALHPSPQEALKLLYRLAADPGIKHVMTRHQWRVGLLSELPPEGKVGISPACLLGLNVNRGQEIRLRLRTDDLRGFRKYDKIRETLIHELAHMVHDEHDNKFKALNSELRRQVLDAGLVAGTVMHLAAGIGGAAAAPSDLGTSHWNFLGDEPATAAAAMGLDGGGARRLGGERRSLSARMAAADAALRRSAAEVQRCAEALASCSGSSSRGSFSSCAGPWGPGVLDGEAGAWEHQDAETARKEEEMRRLEEGQEDGADSGSGAPANSMQVDGA